MPLTHKSYTVQLDSPEVGTRIDRIVQSLCGWSRAQVAGLLDHGCVTLNGERCEEPGRLVAAGDTVALDYYPGQKYHVRPKARRNLAFGVVFEDRHLIVVEKPADMLTVPTDAGENYTLVNLVSEYLRHVSRARQAFTAHRLDVGVSGLLVFGKSAEIAKAVREQFAQHKPEREYAAIVAGRVREPRGTFESLLATNRALSRYSTDDEEEGERAVTHYRVDRQFQDATLVTVWLETGRRNQIRIHFAEAGHPVLGDPRYGGQRAQARDWPHRRLALHARQLAFQHPVTGEPLKFSSPLPDEMERFVSRAEAAAPRRRP